MFNIPFSITRCSWPVPVKQHEGQWISEPDWQAPSMPYLLQPCWQAMDGGQSWDYD